MNKKHLMHIAIILGILITFFYPQIIGIAQVDSVIVKTKNKTVALPLNQKDKLADEIVAQADTRRKLEVEKQQETIRVLKAKLLQKDLSASYSRVYKKKVVVIDTCIDEIDTVYLRKRGILQRIFNTGN